MQIPPGSAWTLQCWTGTGSGGRRGSPWRFSVWQMVDPQFLLAERLKWHNMDRGGSLLHPGALPAWVCPPCCIMHTEELWGFAVRTSTHYNFQSHLRHDLAASSACAHRTRSPARGLRILFACSYCSGIHHVLWARLISPLFNCRGHGHAVWTCDTGWLGSGDT